MHPKRVLEDLQAAPLRRLSQNFLTSPHWADTLVTALLEDKAHLSAIWEIGPGLGALTEVAKSRFEGTYTAFEADRKFCAFLQGRFPSLQVVEGDFTRLTSLEPYLATPPVGVISNLPYHLSSKILFMLLEKRSYFQRLVLTFQKEFAERLLATPCSKTYGALSVLCQSAFELFPLGSLPPGAFYPAPEVHSFAVKFIPKPPTFEWGPFEKVVHTAFRQRRKMMLSNLAQEFPRLKVQAAFDRLQLLPTIRAEELTPSQFEALTNHLSCDIDVAGAREL